MYQSQIVTSWKKILLDKRAENVSATVYTRKMTRQLALDVERHNTQYAPINVLAFQQSHDRFLCIDDDVYHIGASVKDLGKKWFAFSKMEDLASDEIIRKITGVS